MINVFDTGIRCQFYKQKLTRTKLERFWRIKIFDSPKKCPSLAFPRCLYDDKIVCDIDTFIEDSPIV